MQYRLVPRNTQPRTLVLAAPLLAIAATLVCGLLAASLAGIGASAVLEAFFVAPVSDHYGVGELLIKAAPLALIALGLSIGFRANVWNIGAEGQLVLGAARRHFQELLIAHIVVGVAFVTPLVLHVGVRAWGLNRRTSRLQRLGLALVGGIVVQIVLGLTAWLTTAGVGTGALEGRIDLAIATAHQWFGAVLLAMAVVIACYNFRLLAPR